MQPAKAVLEKFLRKGFDADETPVVVFCGSLAQKQGRKAAADFDDQLRLKMADHAVSDQCIRAVKEMVIEIKVARFFSWRRWKLLVLIPEFWKTRSQQIELHGGVHVNAHQFTGPIPQSFRQTLSVRNRLIEVHRCHMKTMPFPDREYVLKFPAV